MMQNYYKAAHIHKPELILSKSSQQDKTSSRICLTHWLLTGSIYMLEASAANMKITIILNTFT